MRSTAPLQLDNLSSEKLLQLYCQALEEKYLLVLWERFMDRKNRKSQSSQPNVLSNAGHVESPYGVSRERVSIPATANPVQGQCSHPAKHQEP